MTYGQDYSPIGIQHKRNVLHPAIRQFLLPAHTFLFKALARCVKIIDSDTDMTESLRFIVAVMVLEVSIFFSPVIPSQLQQTLPFG